MSEERLEIDARARERRVYDRLRARILKIEPGARSGVRDLVLLLPDLAVLLVRLVRDPKVPFGSKAIALLGVSYAVSPVDLLPELLVGPIGLIDDLIVVSAALSRIVNNVHPDLVRAHWSGQGDALDAIRQVTAWAESFLGSVLARVLGFRRVPAGESGSAQSTARD
jgi:uncharacterized membrane protein YkvA (DUF1232 family)